MAKRVVERTTLTGIAEAAGVSVATVSKVVNGRSDVSPETRARVEQLLVERDYVARGPGGAQSPVRAIDLTFDQLVNPNNLVITQGVTQAAAEAGVDVVIGTAPDDPLGAAWARKVTNAGREGVILVTSELTARQRAQFAQHGIPLVLIDPMNVPDDTVPSIGATNFSGGMAATEHLLELGHRRIAMIEGRHDAVCNTARLHGYQAALSGAGLTPDPHLIKRGPSASNPRTRPPWNSSPSTIRPRQSSPPTTFRPSASSRPPGSRGCAYRRTSASSASTTPPPPAPRPRP